MVISEMLYVRMEGQIAMRRVGSWHNRVFPIGGIELETSGAGSAAFTHA
jgi:hypothetical protein